MITTAQLQILQHSLGVDQYGQGDQYRNHFVTGEGSADHADCMALVMSGFMSVQRNHSLSGGDDLFRVTDSGKKYVVEYSPMPAKLSRAKRRYWEYLQCADLFQGGFGEYLRRIEAERKRVAV